MNMKNNTYKFIAWITAICFILSGYTLNGQGNDEAISDKIKTERIGFITSALDLSPNEAQTFWPIYNEYDAKRSELKKEMLKLRRRTNNLSAEESITNYLTLRRKQVDLDEDYINEFRSILTADKVYELIKVEERFKMHLIDKVKKRMKRRNRTKG